MSTSGVAPNLNAVLDRIRAWSKANDWKPATFARVAGVADNVTRDMDCADWSPSSTSIRRLEATVPKDWCPGDPVPVKGKARAA